MKQFRLFLALILTTTFSFGAQALTISSVIKTANCQTAGTLATEAASYLTTVTNLTVTGIIDASDFKTMRDAMPKLVAIDLSNANIIAYSGSNGTNYTSPSNYLDDAIPEYAFYDKFGLKSFTYPSSATIIGESAFNSCSGLTGSLTIPQSIKTIGNSAFFYCTGFTGSVTIGSLVQTIGESAFRNCTGFTGSLDIPSNVTSIGNRAFESCGKFNGTLTLGSSITTIGDYAFLQCSSFTGSVTIPASVTSIGLIAFRWFGGLIDVAEENLNYSSIDGVLFNKDQTVLIECPMSKAGSFTIPNSVTTILNGAFMDCSELTTINAPATPPIGFATAFISEIKPKANCVLHLPLGAKISYANKTSYFTDVIEDIIPNSQEKSELSNYISISPNPATNYIIISELSTLATDKMITLTISDISGCVLITKNIETTISELTLDVSLLKSGIYLATIQASRGNVFTEKFVKE